MEKCRFDTIILIGQGTIARQVVQSLDALRDENEFILKCIIHEDKENNPLGAECRARGVSVECIEDKEMVTDYLLECTNGTRALIISAFNNYWFPKKIVELDTAEIINYHNSFLPQYQGGNAITWAIFNEEQSTGATWHYVTSKADNGDIIWQRRFDIKKDSKAYEVSRTSMKIAYEGFSEFIPELLSRHIKGKKQIHPDGIRDMHFFKDLPMNGVFTADQPVETIYRLLRSMDYGKWNNWISLKMKTPDGKVTDVKAYRLVKHTADMLTEKGIIYLRYNDESHLKIVLEAE